ncbi:hypothetical protein C4A76_21855 [Brevibacillus laterosporus]|nr:hypothetical protein C4A76_21855 [Brevibacillus laterosporus]
MATLFEDGGDNTSTNKKEGTWFPLPELYWGIKNSKLHERYVIAYMVRNFPRYRPIRFYQTKVFAELKEDDI